MRAVKMRKTTFSFGIIFLAGILVTFILQDIIMGLTSLIFVVPQVIFLLLLFLVLLQLYNS